MGVIQDLFQIFIYLGDLLQMLIDFYKVFLSFSNIYIMANTFPSAALITCIVKGHSQK